MIMSSNFYNSPRDARIFRRAPYQKFFDSQSDAKYVSSLFHACYSSIYFSGRLKKITKAINSVPAANAKFKSKLADETLKLKILVLPGIT